MANPLQYVLYKLNTELKARRSLTRLKGILETTNDILLVHQMGRVASMTIFNSLTEACPTLPIFHTHALNYFHVRQRLKRLKGGEKIFPPLHIRVSRLLSDDLRKNLNNRSWKIVTIVRDPVARNLSTFFLFIDNYFPNFQRRYALGEISPPEMRDVFLKEYDHSIPLRWFDEDVKDVFGIDVFEHSFPHTKGYTIFSLNNVSLLAIRLENLQQCYRKAFDEFLGLSRIELKNTHITEKHDSHGAYKNFTDNIELPEWYMDDIYSSKLAQHFYATEEIAEFRGRWSCT